ncbi:MAG TPA: LysE family translocator [Chitinophagaceae bacterium]|nr:LysE family translocator [Chitinophagaceae bacterium]
MIPENFWMFALTGLLLNLTPGSDMLYIIARSSGQGTKAGVISALGVGAGCLFHILAAVVGLSTLIEQSLFAFNIIKYIGAAYLVYLGLKSILNRRRSFEVKHQLKPLSLQKIFWQGVLTNMLNPKVALFFLALLPQFINVHKGNTSLQILFLGAWFNVVGTIVNILVAVLFGSVGRWLLKFPYFVQWQERITGIFLIGIGIKVALSSKK